MKGIKGNNKTFDFSGTQLELLKNHELKVCYCGPQGTGKSWAVLAKIYLIAQKYPGARILLVRDTKASLTQSTLVTLEREVFHKNEKALIIGGNRKGRTSYVLTNGSEIVLGGVAEPERVFSTEYDVIVIEEATVGVSFDAYESLLGRLRNGKTSYHQMILVCNPSSPHHWIKQEADKGKIKLINAKHTDNPKLYNLQNKEWTEKGLNYLSILQGYSDIKRKRLYEGNWVEAEGLIFTEWNDSTHIVSDINDISFDNYYGVIDFGYTDAGVAMKVGRTHEDELYIIKSECRTRFDINWWAGKVKEIQGDDSMVWICDSASPASIETLKQAGINAVPTKKGPGSKLKNISVIKARLLPSIITNKPKLFWWDKANLSPDPYLLRDKEPWNLPMEMGLYSWRKNKEGQSKEEPQDGGDHHIDALGYLCNYLSNAPKAIEFAFAM